MQTSVYWAPTRQYQKWTKGLLNDRRTLPPVLTFWNPLFPRQYLRHNPDITSRFIMIEVPLSPFKLRWRKLMLRIFNFKIGRLVVITNNNDPTILKFIY